MDKSGAWPGTFAEARAEMAMSKAAIVAKMNRPDGQAELNIRVVLTILSTAVFLEVRSAFLPMLIFGLRNGILEDTIECGYSRWNSTYCSSTDSRSFPECRK